jgi:hypothetical protein
MLMAPNGDDESHSGADATLSPDAVDAINKAKAAVEALPGCAGKVSCADILAMAARDVVSLVTQRPLAHQSSYRFHRSALSISYAYTMAIPCGACPPVAAGRTGASGQARTDPHQSLRLAGRVGSVQFALPLHCTCTASSLVRSRHGPPPPA